MHLPKFHTICIKLILTPCFSFEPFPNIFSVPFGKETSNEKMTQLWPQELCATKIKSSVKICFALEILTWMKNVLGRRRIIYIADKGIKKAFPFKPVLGPNEKTLKFIENRSWKMHRRYWQNQWQKLLASHQFHIHAFKNYHFSR